MDRELAEIKIEALLHDPPGKAPTLWYRSHERFSAELVDMVLGAAPRHEQRIVEADRLASAVDRTVLRDPVSFRVDFLQDPRIVHTLSGTRYELQPLANEAPDRFESEQRAAVEHLVGRAGGAGADPERLYWYVWRGLEPALGERGEVGRLWSHLPADTRIPDHSIWDHMRLTSAFAGALPEPALLLFSFGPVQSLIEAARRTGDLWAGSFLLSWLAWRAMRELVAGRGADAVLFPDLIGQPLVDQWLREERGWGGIPGLKKPGAVASLPNRFLALVPAGDGERLARACEGALVAAAEEFARGGVADFAAGIATRAEAWGQRAAQQAASALMCHWYVLPWTADAGELRRLSDGLLGTPVAGFWETARVLQGARLYRPNPGTYFAVQSALVEAGHAAAKATRRFAQIDERGGRCTVCGLREALWGSGDGRPAGPARLVRTSERLCGVCAARRTAPRAAWARRLAGESVVFPSTHNLAATRFFEQVLERLVRDSRGEGDPCDRAVAEALGQFVEAAREVDAGAYATEALMRQASSCGRHAQIARDFVRLPAELLDLATLDARRRDEGAREELGLDDRRAGELRRALEGLLRACDEAKIARARSYYAVLVMDGDHMGRWLAGEKAPALREVLHERALPLEGGEYLDRQRPLSIAHQVAVSRALNQFSLEIVGPVIEQVHGGAVVYAGGDDALAMLPLHAVLPCLRDLRRLYSGLSLPEGSRAREHHYESKGGHVRRGGRLWRVMGERATCSMGVAIAHQKWPLRHALATAREMERLAKDGLGRNAVAIALLKRSGGHERFAARWGECDGVRDPDPLAVLERVAGLIEGDKVSRRFAYALREEVGVLWPLKGALAERAYWLLDRHWRKSRAPFEPDQARALARELGDVADWLDKAEVKWALEDGEPVAMRRFVAGLGLAEFIARRGETGE